MVAVLVLAWGIAWTTGLLDDITIESVRAQVAAWGAFGVVGFVVLACVANVLHVPGMILVVAAILAFGDLAGPFIGWAGAMAAAMTTFLSMRALGGRGSSDVKNRLAKRILSGLEDRPVWTVALLRVVFQNAPILNTVLALSPIRTRGYLVGSALGMVPPVVAAALFTGCFVS